MRTSLVSLALSRSVIGFAVHRGASLDQLCAAAGVTPVQLADPDARIPGERAREVWRLAVAQTGDPTFGLHLGELAEPATLGLVGYVMLSAPDLRSALHHLLRFSNLLTDGLVGHLTVEGPTATIALTPTAGLENFLLTEPRQPIECTVASLLAMARHLCGRRLPTTAVAFAHAAPAATLPHERILGVVPHFSTPETRLSFRAEALAWPVLQSNPALLEAFAAQAAAALARLDLALPWSQRVAAVLADLYRGHAPTLAEAARALQTSERSLQRLLQTEGTSFREVADAVCYQLACRHLQNPATSLGEIAYLLGFSEPSAFHRSFKRWAGQTPQEFRLKTPPVGATAAPPARSSSPRAE